MKEDDKKILVIGIGNQGRADDGLGWAFIDHIKDHLPENIDHEYRYQLQIEDAELLSHYSEVYFVDADKKNWQQGFGFAPCKSDVSHGFSTHELDPETVLYLANTIYNTYPKAYILGITGMDFQLKIGLSPKAEINLNGALEYFNEKILHLIN